MTHVNPFEYDGANDLPASVIVDWYIEDFNYSRFIQSRRNILLVGERGCGKSMTLLYNSWPLQRLKAVQEKRNLPYEFIGVYVPCKTPLIHRSEYGLLGDLHGAALSEHQLVLSLSYSIAQTLASDGELSTECGSPELRARLAFVLDAELDNASSVFTALMDFAQRESLRTQRAINDRATPGVEVDRTYSFASLIVPLLGLLRTVPRLRDSHFMLMIDDAQDLNPFQIQALTSWIAYRDHSLCSFKVALADLGRQKLHTAAGGSILEGHDYLRLDMVQAFHNEISDFGRHAQKVVARRLERVGMLSSPDEFFPISEQLKADLADAEASVRNEAEKRYGNDSDRVSDYVYKYKRAQYFRSRSPKANRPEYSGFATLVFLSTGVIRNLLMPCYWMFDKVVSIRAEGEHKDEAIQCIPPSVQSEIILERSRKLWDWLRNGIDAHIVGCSREDAIRCYRLLDHLAMHFRERLLNHTSEPRANSFTLSGKDDSRFEELQRLLDILREAQLLYVRSGPAKERGQREWYYIPNRMLWPERGLDPHGQHARVSLKVADLWSAAVENRPLTAIGDTEERGLFDGRV